MLSNDQVSGETERQQGLSPDPNFEPDIWRSAIESNRAIPSLETRTRDSLVITIDGTAKDLFRCFCAFAAAVSEVRELTQHTPCQWQNICQLRSGRKYDYAPRWTMTDLYFRGRYASCFSGTDGLDVGARISDPSSRATIDSSSPGGRGRIPPETFVSHFGYYSGLGSRMKAIDINPPESFQSEIVFGDARLLNFESNSFDFATIPMLLGANNPCSTYLEVALCLAELRRVLKPGGLVYIADAGFQPIVGYAAEQLELEVYVSKGSHYGLPVGSLLRKRRTTQGLSPFDEIFSAQELRSISFDSATEVFLNCNLAYDAAPVCSFSNSRTSCSD
ncbi:MAG: ubiE/COQ5 methyltransferase family [Blastocatellia bacterium]|jgi:SAM-dependent methyltransferase|nr:ubiE/COQ5 methyltransferase family [Blastocatellia bacterium]